jgi:hypothetical protein
MPTHCERRSDQDEEVMTSRAVTYLDWDSEFFGVSIARANVTTETVELAVEEAPRRKTGRRQGRARPGRRHDAAGGDSPRRQQ